MSKEMFLLLMLSLIPVIFAPNARQSLSLHWDYLLLYYKCRNVICTCSQYIRTQSLLAHTDMAVNKSYVNILQFTKLQKMLLRVVWTVKLNCNRNEYGAWSHLVLVNWSLVEMMLLNDQVLLNKLIEVVLPTTHLA